MGYKRDSKLVELSKAKIRGTRNAIINEMLEHNGKPKGFLISQQVEFEEDGKITRMFARGGMVVSNIEGLISLRNALDRAIDKMERKGVRVNKDKDNREERKRIVFKKEPEPEVEEADEDEIEMEDASDEQVCESCKINYPDDIEAEDADTDGEWEGEDEGEEDSSESVEELEGAEESEEVDDGEWDSDTDEELDEAEEYEDEEIEAEDSEEQDQEVEEVLEESDYDLGDEEEWES